MTIEDHKQALKPTEITELLDDTDWGPLFKRHELEAVAHYFSVYGFTRGDHLFNEGDTDAYLGVVTAGKIEILKENEDQAPVTLALIGRGKIFGEMALADKSPRSASARAAIDTQIAVLTDNDFNNMIQQDPRLAVIVYQKIIKTISHRLRQTSGKLIDQASDDSLKI